MRKTGVMLASMATAILLASVVGALMAVGPVEAAFPGKNGQIAYNRAFDFWAKNASLTSPETKLLDDAANLTYSPDGTRVAFVRRSPGPEIFVANTNGAGTPRKLTSNTVVDSNPAWSHDGTRIAFQRGTQVWTMNADGTNQRVLTATELPTDNPKFDPTQPSFEPTWSVPLPGAPDGKIAFVHQGWLWTMLADGNGKDDLDYTCPTENGGVCDTVAASPNFSPDGSEIAANYYSDIFIVPSAGGPAKVLLPGPDNKYPGQELDPAWSPDGTKIAFEHNGNVPGSAYGIYMANADGSSTQAIQLTSKTGELDPDWQQDSMPPQTTIASGPSGMTKSTSASFGFSSNEPGSKFQCSLDGVAFAACASPKSYTNLKNGTHTFKVRAIDTAGNVDATPAARSWKVDTIKPTVSGMSPKPKSITRDTTPAITAIVKDRLTNLQKRNIKLFVAGKAIPASKFRYSASTDKLTYNSPNLGKGKKTVKIVATDAAKNVGTKSWYFTIR